MTTASIHLLLFVGALLIAAGCAGPLDASIRLANAEAHSLTAIHGGITAASEAAQRAAARRVKGDRSDPSVRAEQIDRATEAGRAFRSTWDAYGVARRAWLALVAAIQAAQAAAAAGAEPNMAAIERMLLVLADAQRELAEVWEP